MAKKTLLIISDCRFEGKHLAKGSKFDVDIDDKKEANRLAPLVHAGRVALATTDAIEQINAEIEAEKQREEKLNDVAKGKKGKGDKDDKGKADEK